MAPRTPGGAAFGANAVRAWMAQHGQLNEHAVATTFCQRYDSRWRYNEDEGYWLQWMGTHWARQQTLQFLDALGQFTTDLAKIFRRFDTITHTEAIKLQSQRTIGALERICRGLPSFHARSVLFDSNGFLLGTPGGTIDLRNGVMMPANPADYITMLTPVTPAPAGTPLGPRFAKFLHDITGGNKDFQRTLQQLAGIGSQGTSRDQRIVFIYGPGGNGKGVYLRTLSGCLGGYAVTAARDLLMQEKYSRHATHLIDTILARLAICTEVEEDATWDIALIKNVTGGDPMQVNRMKQDPFWVTANCLIVISGNRKPALKGVDDAVKRRFLVMTFMLKVEEKDVIPDLEKLFVAEEGPAILRWMIDGAVAREAEGRLHVAQVIRDDTADYFAEENVLQEFVDTVLETQPLNETPEWRVKTAEIYDEWRAYCTRLGRAAGPRNAFTTAIQTCGIKYHRANDGRYFINVRKRLGYE